MNLLFLVVLAVQPTFTVTPGFVITQAELPVVASLSPACDCQACQCAKCECELRKPAADFNPAVTCQTCGDKGYIGEPALHCPDCTKGWERNRFTPIAQSCPGGICQLPAARSKPVAAPRPQAYYLPRYSSGGCANGQCSPQRRGLFGRR